MNLFWSLCLVCLTGGLRAAQAGPVRKTKKTDNAAPQEEVNILSFGVIQLSDSLKYFFQTTEAKMTKISQTVKSHEDTLQKLGRQTEQAAEVKTEIKDFLQFLQVRKQFCQKQICCVLLNGCAVAKDTILQIKL